MHHQTRGSSATPDGDDEDDTKDFRKRTERDRENDGGKCGPDAISAPRKRQRPETVGLTSSSWSCPFLKRDPIKHMVCIGYKLHRIQDVKQHLQRKHYQASIYCPICEKSFPDLRQRDDHIRRKECTEKPPCGISSSAPSIPPTKQEEIRAIRGSGKEAWEMMWDIIFDHAPRPATPYQTTVIEEVADLLKGLWKKCDSEIIREIMQGFQYGAIPDLEKAQISNVVSIALVKLVDRLKGTVHNGEDSEVMSTTSDISGNTNPFPTSMTDIQSRKPPTDEHTRMVDQQKSLEALNYSRPSHIGSVSPPQSVCTTQLPFTEHPEGSDFTCQQPPAEDLTSTFVGFTQPLPGRSEVRSPLASHQVSSAVGTNQPPATQQSASQSWARSMLSRSLTPDFSFVSKLQDASPCWRCKNSHRKCGHGLRCNPCEAAAGDSKIPCRRGPICSVDGIPFLCQLPPRTPMSSLGVKLSPEQQHAARLIDCTRRRFNDAHKQASSESEDGKNHSSLFARVVATKSGDINGSGPFQEMGLISVVELPYEDIIAQIVWELEDNQEAASLLGIGSVEDLVGFLHDACRRESSHGPYDKKRRLIYNSILCLSYSIQALRLSSQRLLARDPHSQCAIANECVSPGLRSLSKYAVRYTEAFDKAMFHKNRFNNWLLIFYSLCIQSHVRQALMVLEQRQQDEFIGTSATGDFQVPWQTPATAGFLRDAVVLFREISMQNRGKLAAQIHDPRAQHSSHFQQLQQQRSPRFDRSSNSNSTSHQIWEKRRGEGMIEYLEEIFDIMPSPSSSANHAHPEPSHETVHNQAPSQDIHGPDAVVTGDADFDSDPKSDSGVTIVAPKLPAPLTIASTSTSSNNTNSNSALKEAIHDQSISPWIWSIFDQKSTSPSSPDFDWTHPPYSPATMKDVMDWSGLNIGNPVVSISDWDFYSDNHGYLR